VAAQLANRKELGHAQSSALNVSAELPSDLAQQPMDGPRPSSGVRAPQLLATKLYLPQSRPDLVARPRLFARLDAGLHGVLTFAVNLLVPGFGGAWEKPRWRGYLLPQLQARRSTVAASLIIAVVGIAWHLPLFLTGEIQWLDVGSMVGGHILFAWIYNRTGGSILLVMLTHATNNTISAAWYRSCSKAQIRSSRAGVWRSCGW